jgi:DNA (cytosine-5)-methyltransferase 1
VLAGVNRMLKAGQNWRALPPDVQQQAMGASWFGGGGKTGFYRRLSWNKPSPTLVTRPIMPATDLCHPDELRPLSVEEYAAIQTFPEDYVVCGKLDDQYRQIGNAVPCLFGGAIARHLVGLDNGLPPTANLNGKMSRYMGTGHESWRESISGLERQLALYD